VQILFNTKETPQMYADNKGIFPEAPEKCPHKDCHAAYSGGLERQNRKYLNKRSKSVEQETGIT
jgi:hypothetical protein